MNHRSKLLGVAAGALALVTIVPAAGAGTATTVPAPAGDCDTVDSISFQLQWFIQAQFGGFFAADDEGYYAARCLEVEFLEGGVDITPQQVLADGGADFAATWVPKALATREAGADIVHIAQILNRSGTLQLSFADSGIESPEDFAGRSVGNWGFGNEYEVFAGMAQAGIDPADVTHVQQGGDMAPFVAGDIEAAEAMTYNEYALVLETINPETGELFQPEDLNIISYEELGVGMLQDSIWADGARLADDAAYRDIAIRFVAASIEGWAFCRDNPEACSQYALDAGAQSEAGHQLWMMNEVNKLIWPAPDGFGKVSDDAWNATVDIAINTPNADGTTFITAEPDEGARTSEIIDEAYALLGDSLDLEGADFEPIEVTLQEGGV
jgi:NitT/TauT family transport system substrate-binding protein